VGMAALSGSLFESIIGATVLNTFKAMGLFLRMI
jgi:hypothetical protein